MPACKLVINNDGLDAQFRLVADDDEEEEGEILSDGDDDEDGDADDGEDEELNAGNNDISKSAEVLDVDSDVKGNKPDCKDDTKTTGPQDDDQQSSKPCKTKKQHPRISLFEMQSFLIALILPEPRLSTPPKWCKVLRCMRASNVGIFLVENDDLDWIPDKGKKFTHAFKFETPPNWMEQLVSIPLSRRLQSQTTPSEFRAGSKLFEGNLNARPRISRTSLLLSPVQQIVENYTMPTQEGIQILRSKYKPVTDRSPMFAIDCEMCITNRSELTRISIVDEELNVVYNELVKPDEPITNYLTRYSGITKHMMENVTLRLEDVHHFLRKNLPRDSIYVGHSLNMDLAALEIFHPYVIDTSVIYNRTGVRTYKPSLKSLAYEFLNKEIQSSNRLGHDSLEDALTSMELVKLKLVNGLVFGDSVAYEKSLGIKFDSKTGITHLQFDKFIERHDVTKISYRCIDTTPGARCVYIHDKMEPLGEDVREAILHLLGKDNTVCVVLTSAGECYIRI